MRLPSLSSDTSATPSAGVIFRASRVCREVWRGGSFRNISWETCTRTCCAVVTQQWHDPDTGEVVYETTTLENCSSESCGGYIYGVVVRPSLSHNIIVRESEGHTRCMRSLGQVDGHGKTILNREDPGRRFVIHRYSLPFFCALGRFEAPGVACARASLLLLAAHVRVRRERPWDRPLVSTGR